jgi:nicotinate phosphoribosyltransferase
MKRSDSPAKVLNPGRKRLWRVYDDRHRATADVLSTSEESLEPGVDLCLHHHARPDMSRTLAAGHWVSADELLVAVLDEGKVVYPDGAGGLADLSAAGERRRNDIEALDPGVRRLVNPHRYHVSISDGVFELKRELLAEMT